MYNFKAFCWFAQNATPDGTNQNCLLRNYHIKVTTMKYPDIIWSKTKHLTLHGLAAAYTYVLV